MRMFEDSKVAARIPVQDLQRARTFYAQKLGLEPSEESPGDLLYRCGEAEFVLFESAGAGSGHHTQMGWEVKDSEGNLFGKGAWFRDSEGNLLGIGQPMS